MMDNLFAAGHSVTACIVRRCGTRPRLPWPLRIVLLGIVAIGSLLLASAEPAEAATFIVEDGAAVGDGDPGDGVCRSKFRPGTLLRNCTLMAAVEEANALPGNHAVLL